MPLSLSHKTAVVSVMAAAVAIFMFFMPIKSTPVVFGDNITCKLPSTFSLKWQHSVEKQYWQEVYQLDFPKLILTKAYLQTFGAGTPSTGKPTLAPKGYLGERLDIPVETLNWLVSTNMQGEILLGDAIQSTPNVLPIHQIVSNQSTVVIKPIRLTVWQSVQIDSCQTFSHQPS